MNDHYVLRATAAGMLALIAGTVSATPPSHTSLGATFKIVSEGRDNIIEIRLRPTASFDTVDVEAGSGVQSFTPPCAFSAVEAGGAYSCQVSVAAKRKHPSFTLNVIGTKAVDPEKPRIVEVHHFTVPNAQFAPPSATRSRQPIPSLVTSPSKDNTK